jgi:twitching motility protein PilT
MAQAFSLRKMLAEIAEDERYTTSKRRKVSQADIRKLLMERQKGLPAAEASSENPPGDSTPFPGQDPAVTAAWDSESTSMPVSDVPSPMPSPLGEPREGTGRDPGGLFHCTTPQTDRRHVDQAFLSVIPPRLLLQLRMIPLCVENRVIHMAMENPDDWKAIQDVEILTERRVNVVRVDSGWLKEQLGRLEEGQSRSWFESAGSRNPEDNGILSILLEMLVIFEGSDLLIGQGMVPRIKTPQQLEDSGLPAVSAMECVQCAQSLMSEAQWERFLREGSMTFSWQDPVQGLFRIHATRERNAPSLVIHRIPASLPSFEDLGLPSWMEEMTTLSSGLVVFTGPPGNGKTTTLHAVVSEINRRRSCNIVMLEEPVEYLHSPGKSHICQREIGRDVENYEKGIKDASRHSVDVIVVGHLVFPEVFMDALAAARSGHLVLTTCEAIDTTAAVELMIQGVPRSVHPYGLPLMDDTRLCIVAQKLLPTLSGGTVIPVCERLWGGPRFWHMLSSAPPEHLRDRLVQSVDDLISFDDEIRRLAAEGRIPPEQVIEGPEGTASPAETIPITGS